MSDTASRSELVRIRGLRLHLRHWGREDAPKLLLLTGWLDTSATFQYLAEGLLDRWHVICPDWRGFGLSEWAPQGYWIQDYIADLDEIARHCCGEASFPLVGHSLGAQIGSLYAGIRPQRVTHLALLDGPFVPDGNPDEAPRRYLAWLSKLREPQAEKRYASYEELASRVARIHPQLSPERALFVARCWGREDAQGRVLLRNDPVHRLPWPTMHRVAESMAIWRCIEAPTLFVDAAQSGVRWLPDAEIERRRAVFRDHRVVRIDGAGHMLHLDAPEATAAALRAFLPTS